MRINYSEYSSIGGRSRNEDMVQVTSYPESALALVADGLGGHGDGDRASRLAVHVISREVASGMPSRSLMERALREANECIIRRQSPECDMKTTVAALWLSEGRACAAHIGDTRIYQFRNQQILYQSVDHSLAQLAVTLGEISADEIRHHCDRNHLTRALGHKADIKMDIDMLHVQPGDAFLLCSDGFWEHILEAEMLETLRAAADAEAWLSAMRRRAESRMGLNADNSTAVAMIVCG